MTTPPADHVLGTVRVWYDGDGWGVIDSPATPGGCWVHFSDVLVEDYRSLEVGQQVLLSFEQGWQDGYSYRATAVRVEGRPEPASDRDTGPCTAMSSMEIIFDDPGRSSS